MQQIQKKATPKKVLIIGGGFAGVRCALDLLKRHTSDEIEITLVTDGDHFTYYPAMYRYVTGAPFEHVALSYAEMFEGKENIRIINDHIVHFDAKARIAIGGTSATEYTGDYILMAVGTENNYFRIEGVDEVSFNFKSLHAAKRLHDRLHDLFKKHSKADTAEMLVALHFVIVGGGPSGVELAGELAIYARKLAHIHNLPESLVTIDIVERNSRLLGRMPEKLSHKVEKRLRLLGVNLLLNRTMEKSESWTVFLGDMKLGAKTVVWTAGVKPVAVTKDVEGASYSKRGTFEVNEHLEMIDGQNIFALGDVSNTPKSGLAQTAIAHGRHVASVISADLNDRERPRLRVPHVGHIFPIGPGWGAFQFGKLLWFGYLAYLLRFVADYKFYLSVLPFRNVWKIWRTPHESLIHASNSNHVDTKS